MITVKQNGKEVARMHSMYAVANSLGCSYSTIRDRLISGAEYRGLTFEQVDAPVQRIAIFKNGDRVHTGYGLEHASELTGLAAGKILILIETGVEYNGYSFDQDDELEKPDVIMYRGKEYKRVYNGYKHKDSRRYLHRVKYEDAHGSAPKRIYFRDGDKHNCDIDNLY